jgi:hypothetical protein
MQSRMSGASSKQHVQQSVGAYAGSLLYRAEQKRDDDLIKIKGVRRAFMALHSESGEWITVVSVKITDASLAMHLEKTIA